MTSKDLKSDLEFLARVRTVIWALALMGLLGLILFG